MANSFTSKLRESFSQWGLIHYAYGLVLWAMLSLPLYYFGWGIWSLLALPLFLALVLAGIYAADYCTTRFLPSAPALTSRRSHFIHFSTHIDSQERQGSLSFIEGIGRGTWTTEDGGSSGTLEVALSESDFRELWNTARWLKELKQFEPAKPDVRLDFRSNYVVAIQFTDNGQSYSTTYLIPHDCQVPKVADWVNSICLTHPLISMMP